MPANADHEKCAKTGEKNCLANSAFGNPDFLSNVRYVCNPGTENQTKTGIEKCRCKILFILEEEL
jgi:hypothetical protein